MLLSLPAYLSPPVKILLTLQGQVSPLLDTFLNPQSQVMPPSLCPQPPAGVSSHSLITGRCVVVLLVPGLFPSLV